MRFPCKSCGAVLDNPQVDLMDTEFFWQECPACGAVRSYSRLRIEQIPRKT